MISIVIPAYNAERYIAKSIKSCIAQTYINFEIVVINDGSTDRTLDIVKDLQQTDNRIILVNKENGGLVSARKEAMSHIHGDFVFFMDADDYISSGTLSSLSKFTSDYDVIIGDMLLENEKGENLRFQHTNKQCFCNVENGLIIDYLYKNITPSLCGRLIRSTLFNPYLTPNDLTIGEDVVTNIIIANRYNPRIKIVNSAFYHYVQYPSSMANFKTSASNNKRIEYANWVIKYTSSIQNSLFLTKSLSYFVLSEYYSYLRDGGEPKKQQSFHNTVYNKYYSQETLSKFPLWSSILLRSYRKSTILGKFVRNCFLFVKSLIQK